MKSYLSYQDWFEDQSSKNQKIISNIEDLILKTLPKLKTFVKWGQGCFVSDNTPRIFLHTEPDYVQLSFYNGSQLIDKYGLLEDKGKFVRHVKIHDPEIKNITQITKLIKQLVN